MTEVRNYSFDEIRRMIRERVLGMLQGRLPLQDVREGDQRRRKRLKRILEVQSPYGELTYSFCYLGTLATLVLMPGSFLFWLLLGFDLSTFIHIVREDMR